jgi:hypothetical protein
VLDLSRFGGRYENRVGLVALYDGGLGSNSPIEIFVNASDSFRKSLQECDSLLCIFEEEGAGHRAMSTIKKDLNTELE